MSRAITLVLPFYDNAGQLREQQACWRALPDELRKRLHVIVVDDCSPNGPALPAVDEDRGGGVASFQLYRTLKDIRWNWLFCRNLGMHFAPTSWVLMTDIDHVLPAETLRHLLDASLNKRNVYRFRRVDAPRPWPYEPAECTPYKEHPNSWFMTREMFDLIGGYDERFSGFYGTDGEFRDRVQKNAQRIVMLDHALVRYPREIIPDASTTTYARKQPEDAENVPRIRKERDLIADWRPLRMTFPWERLI